LQYRLEVLGELSPLLFGGQFASKLNRVSEKREERRPVHVCRLWDDLISVVKKNKNLHDESLWKLVAVLNGLSTKVDAKGNPIAKLKRGQVLTLPSEKDVRDYRRLAAKSAVSDDQSRKSALDPATDASQTVVSASSEFLTSTIRTAPIEQFKVFGERVIELGNCRIHSAEWRYENHTKYQMKLEFFHEAQWCSVVEYIIGQDQSELHSFALNGVVKIIRMALPVQSVLELAECDLATNYGEYCKRFVRDRNSV
jgi:hypothetical protein